MYLYDSTFLDSIGFIHPAHIFRLLQKEKYIYSITLPSQHLIQGGSADKGRSFITSSSIFDVRFYLHKHSWIMFPSEALDHHRFMEE